MFIIINLKFGIKEAWILEYKASFWKLKTDRIFFEMRIKSRWNKRAKEQSLEEITKAVAFIIAVPD